MRAAAALLALLGTLAAAPPPGPAAPAAEGKVDLPAIVKHLSAFMRKKELGKRDPEDVAKRIALEDEYFVSRRLYPNVDFYSGLIYQAMGFPVDMFPVLFAIPRTSGWIAQWEEMLLDQEQKIARPKQIYIGPRKRDYVRLSERK